MTSKLSNLLILSLGHLIVDLCGIYLISMQNKQYDFIYIGIYYLVYNLIAFGLEPFIGYYIDRINGYRLFTCIGLILPVIGLYLIDLGLIAILISTLGNAIYHVSGGVIAYNLFPRKASPNGVFVAPGAIGVLLGFLIAGVSSPYKIESFVLLPVIIIIFFIIVFNKRNDVQLSSHRKKHASTRTVLLIMVTILMRGLIGSILIFNWTNDITLYILFVISIFVGKLIGGILGDLIGLRKVGVSGLILSSIPICLGIHYPIFAYLGVLLFNLTMGITLYLIMSSLGKYQGMAFGLTTLSLLVGVLPKLLGYTFTVGTVYYLIILGLITVTSVTFFNAITNLKKEAIIHES